MRREEYVKSLFEILRGKLIKEAEELFVKLVKLNNFIAGEKFKRELDCEEQRILVEQAAYMTNYHKCLTRRIAILNNKLDTD